MSEKIVITVNEGKIRGIKNKSPYSGVEFYSFYGIPYAQPPVKNLRYRDPIKVKPWKNIYDATTEKGGCIQFSLQTYQMSGSEDCLYNNIHTSNLPCDGKALKAVIVNIHPGAYFFGSPDSSQYGSPHFVMHHDIVYVNIGFRLHILGFLNLGVEQCSGNQALKDIILGLRWIQENIHFFNGDPNNITLLGSSSGATIIHFLMMSPAARGLFHKSVIMGLHVFNPIISFEEDNTSAALQAAKALGYKGDETNMKMLLSFLKRIPTEMLIMQNRELEKQRNENIAAVFPCSMFIPTIDQGENAVLPESPKKLLQSMIRIPIIYGVCEKESILGFSRGTLYNGTMQNYKTCFCQNVWGWGDNLNNEQIHFINEQIRLFYLNGDTFENAPLETKVDILTDIAFSNIYETLIDPIAEDLPDSVFIYMFSYEGGIPTIKNALQLLLDEQLKGTFHGCDYSYWANINTVPCVQPVTMVEIFTKFVTTFAKTGDPNHKDFQVQWRPSTLQSPGYLLMNDESKMIDGKLNGKRMEFWQNLVKVVLNQ